MTLARAVSRRGGMSHPILQRTEESAAILKKLAKKPVIGQAPTPEVQTELVRRLETQDRIVSAGEANLGGILITHMPESDEELIEASELMNLFVPSRSKNFVSGGSPRFDEVEAAGAKDLVVQNTLRTMIAAGQVEYLRVAGLPNEEWVILVEVHYIRARPKTATGLHKDTKGQTLFVNLNYHIPSRVQGPEYVVNPLPHEGHDDQVSTMQPPTFREDLLATRTSLESPTMIENNIVDPYGFVAFVDEGLHHATPLYGHRVVIGSEMKTFLQTRYPDEFAAAARAYTTYAGSWWSASAYPFATYLEKNSGILNSDGPKWLMLMEIAQDVNKDKAYTRVDFQKTMSTDEIDLMLEAIGTFAARSRTGAFNTASIPQAGPYAKAFDAPIKTGDRPPLKRRASQTQFRATMPEQLPEEVPRRFIRTWVRALPISAVEELHAKAPVRKEIII